MLDFDLFEKSKGVWRVRSTSRGDKMAPETDASWPKVLRRVASYSADVFHNQTVCTEHLRRPALAGDVEVDQRALRLRASEAAACGPPLPRPF